jgi:hypothetical protein
LECLLWLSGHFELVSFNERKGFTVLFAVALVGTTVALIFGCFAICLLVGHPFQFSIRSLLIAVVVVAVPSSWLGAEMRQAERQREAVRDIKGLNGVVEYRGFPPPYWLRRLMGDDFFADATDVVFYDGGDMRAALDAVKRLRGIQDLRLSGTSVDDSALKDLEGLRELIALDLCRTNITDAGFAHLKGLAKLRLLNISNTRLTDAGLQHLIGLNHLETLVMADTDVTGQGVTELRRALPKCRVYCSPFPGGMGKKSDIESAGQNRHGVADERAARKSSSEAFQP